MIFFHLQVLVAHCKSTKGKHTIKRSKWSPKSSISSQGLCWAARIIFMIPDGWHIVKGLRMVKGCQGMLEARGFSGKMSPVLADNQSQTIFLCPVYVTQLTGICLTLRCSPCRSPLLAPLPISHAERLLSKTQSVILTCRLSRAATKSLQFRDLYHGACSCFLWRAAQTHAKHRPIACNAFHFDFFDS